MWRKIRRSCARVLIRVSRWDHVSTERVAPGESRILIGAPHTSNWDFIMMLGIAWDLDFPVRWLGKDSLFRGVMGPVMRAIGGIPVDRRRPFGLVEDLVEQAKVTGDGFTLVVTPEGTRGAGKYWKSGFYRIAMATGIPVTLGYVDRTTRTFGLGMTFTPTGDVRADMDTIRAFYQDKAGYHPQNRTEPRLREEDKGTSTAK